MYYSNLAISVLVVCTYGAIMSQPMTYWREAAALLLTKVYTLTMMGISRPTGAETSCNRTKHHSPMTPMPSADGWEGGGTNSIPILHKCAPPHEVRSECPVEMDRVQAHAVPRDITC